MCVNQTRIYAAAGLGRCSATTHHPNHVPSMLPKVRTNMALGFCSFVRVNVATHKPKGCLRAFCRQQYNDARPPSPCLLLLVKWFCLVWSLGLQKMPTLNCPCPYLIINKKYRAGRKKRRNHYRTVNVAYIYMPFLSWEGKCEEGR